jgi:hypothetical protein
MTPHSLSNLVLDLDPHSPKKLDPDPHKIDADPKHNYLKGKKRFETIKYLYIYILSKLSFVRLKTWGGGVLCVFNASMPEP